MTITIRDLASDDEPFLWKALFHAIHTPPGTKPSHEMVQKPELARYVAGWMQHPDDFGFIAEDAGTPVGAVWCRRWPAGRHGYGFVDEATPELSMSLLPEYRGRGIGTKLLRQLLADAGKRFDAISLSVSVTNPAHRLYEREGFTAAGTPENGSIIMIKRLHSNM